MRRFADNALQSTRCSSKSDSRITVPGIAGDIAGQQKGEYISGAGYVVFLHGRSVSVTDSGASEIDQYDLEIPRFDQDVRRVNILVEHAFPMHITQRLQQANRD